MNKTSIEVELGADICTRLKHIYFEQQEWAKCYMQVAQIFTRIKKFARNFFAGEDIVQILKKLQKFSDQDLMDCNIE